MLRDEIRAITSTRRDLRNFGFVVGAGFCVIGGLLLWKERPAAPSFLGIGLALAVLGGLYPPVLKPLQKAWMVLAVCMGWVMTRVILSILFFLVLTPIGLVARVAGKHFLDKLPQEEIESYWRRREKEAPGRKHFDRQF